MSCEKEVMTIQTLHEAREMCEDGMHRTTAGGPKGPLAPKFKGLDGLRSRAKEGLTSRY